MCFLISDPHIFGRESTSLWSHPAEQLASGPLVSDILPRLHPGENGGRDRVTASWDQVVGTGETARAGVNECTPYSIGDASAPNYRQLVAKRSDIARTWYAHGRISGVTDPILQVPLQV